jgi:hypothetical protein
MKSTLFYLQDAQAALDGLGVVADSVNLSD